MTDVPPLTLSTDEATAVVEVTAAFAAALPDDRAAPDQDLGRAAAGHTVPADRLEVLEQVCALALQTGQARRLGRAEAERLLVGVYRRTPAGKAALAEVADTNRALDHLRGRTLQSARITWRTPGRYYLNLTVSGFDLTLAVEPDGVRVQSLHAG